jgi:hypothetical protein
MRANAGEPYGCVNLTYALGNRKILSLDFFGGVYIFCCGQTIQSCLHVIKFVLKSYGKRNPC